MLLKRNWVLVFSFVYLVSVDQMDRLSVAKSDQKQKTKNGTNKTIDKDSSPQDLHICNDFYSTA